MSKTPFEIRLEVLSMAKDLLIEEWYKQYDAMDRLWEREAELIQRDPNAVRGALPPRPQMPPYPTTHDIIAKAKSLNEFVSNTGL